MNLRTVIVDDEDLAIDLLKYFISAQSNFKLLETFTSAKIALAYVNKYQPEVLFLDIQMPELTGLNLIEALNYAPIVVFVTAYTEYAQIAYELDVVDYLLKPYDKNRFHKSIDKIRQFASYKSNQSKMIDHDFLFVKHNGLLKKVPFEEILFVEGLKQYVKIITKEGKFITLNSIKSMEEQLQTHNFKRIHKSYIVNFNKEISVSGNVLKTATFQIPIGRSFKANLLR